MGVDRLLAAHGKYETSPILVRTRVVNPLRTSAATLAVAARPVFRQKDVRPGIPHRRRRSGRFSLSCRSSSSQLDIDRTCRNQSWRDGDDQPFAVGLARRGFPFAPVAGNLSRLAAETERQPDVGGEAILVRLDALERGGCRLPHGVADAVLPNAETAAD